MRQCLALAEAKETTPAAAGEGKGATLCMRRSPQTNTPKEYLITLAPQLNTHPFRHLDQYRVQVQGFA